MATIKDVARVSGFSTATVSHVINGSRSVGAETREKVTAAIETLNYRPDGIARSLRRSRSGTIAVLVSDITNPFFAELVRGVEAGAHGHDRDANLLLCNTEENPERERRALDLVVERRIDGLIIAPVGGNEELISKLSSGGLPIVFADRVSSQPNIDAVVIDNFEAARQLTHHLIGLGHQRIACLEAEIDASSIRDRLLGFRTALNEAGLPLSSDAWLSSTTNVEAARQAASRLLQLHPRPDAVFCTNNFMTLGVMEALRDAGLGCPDDLAVAGFDDFSWASAFRPALTVVAQPAFEMGQECANLLFARIGSDPQRPPVQLVLPSRLMIRESAGERLSSPA